jgi:hypothetical protein
LLDAASGRLEQGSYRQGRARDRPAWWLVAHATEQLPGERLSWPEDGPAVGPEGADGELVYRKPTLTTLTSTMQPAYIRDRSPKRVAFSFHECGKLVHYEGEVDQDTLFRVLLDAGLLKRRVER